MQTVEESVSQVIEFLDDDRLIDEDPTADYRFKITRREEQGIKQRLRDLGYIDDE